MSISERNNLLLPAPGYRDYSNGQLDRQTSYGRYWTSAAYSATNARYFNYYSSGTTTTNTGIVGYGFTLRCIKI